jgi:hypothetical protein
MADSIIFPIPVESNAISGYNVKGRVYSYKIEKNTELYLPESLVKAGSADIVLDNIREFAVKKVNFPETQITGFRTYLQKACGVTNDQFEIIHITIDVLVDLIQRNKDSIHPFILKNIYKPSTLGEFDIIIGNPPWLSYRFVNSLERQETLKDLIVNHYTLLDRNSTSNITNLELATLFFVKCTDIYLRPGGTIAFVMPRSLFTADQHHNLRADKINKVKLGINSVWDLKVEPLFNVPSCTIFATKDSKTEYPIIGTLFEGSFPRKDIRLSSIEKHANLLQIKNISVRLVQTGGRSAWSYESIDVCKDKVIRKSRSDYYNLFFRGGDIYPRPFFSIELKAHERFGIDVDKPYIETSRRARETAQDEYKGVFISGSVESRYLYATLLGGDVLPFCNLPFRLIVLPMERRTNSYHLIDIPALKMKGDLGMSDWMSNVEKEWNKTRKEKSSKFNIYEWLDYRQKLSTQDPSSKYIVLYLTSSTFLASCVIDNSLDLTFSIEDLKIKLSGLVVDTKCYFHKTSNSGEAYYLASILNSKVLDTLIKPLQSRGLWGPRDIHKKPLEFPIPKFDSDNTVHSSLSKLGANATEYAKSILPGILAELKIDPESISANAVGRLRGKIREALDNQISETNNLVCELFT